MSTRQSKSSAVFESIGVAAYWVFTTCYCSLGGLALIAILAAVVVSMTGLPYGVTFYTMLALTLLTVAVTALRVYRGSRREALSRERIREDATWSPAVDPVGTPSWY